jgi:hypothetical protein
MLGARLSLLVAITAAAAPPMLRVGVLSLLRPTRGRDRRDTQFGRVAWRILG